MTRRGAAPGSTDRRRRRSLAGAILAAALALSSSAAVRQAQGQEVQCRILVQPWQYGLVGTCLRQGAPGAGADQRSILASMWPDDTVGVFMTGMGTGPWLGTFTMPGRQVTFELARELRADGRSRLVLRNAHSWAIVRRWQVVGDSAVLAFAPEEEADPSDDDIAILTRALAGLDSIGRWDRADDRDCTNDATDLVSLYCLVDRAVQAQMGRVHFRQPAMQVVRSVVSRRWRDRIRSHPLMDFNNDPRTTMADLRRALEASLEQARREVSASGQFRPAPTP